MYNVVSFDDVTSSYVAITDLKYGLPIRSVAK